METESDQRNGLGSENNNVCFAVPHALLGLFYLSRTLPGTWTAPGSLNFRESARAVRESE